MKLKNITNSVRQVKSKSGWISLIGPGEIIEISNPMIDSYVLKSFKILKEKIQLKKEDKTE